MKWGVKMEFKEKKLYHQIHPYKLLTDWITGGIALYLLWQHHLFIALLVMLIPPIVVSLLIVRFLNLEKLKHSTFGKYILGSMTTNMEMVRLAGYVLAVFAAWYHFGWLILLGLMIVFYGWLRGFLVLKFRAK